MGITRKHFLSFMATISIVVIFFLMISYFTLPIYYNQSRKEVLRQEFNAVLKQLDGMPEKKMVTALRKYEAQHQGLFFSLSNEKGRLIYPEQDRLDDYDIESESFSDSKHAEAGYWTETVKTDVKDYLIVTGQYIFPSLTSISQTLLTLYPFIILLFMFLVFGAAFLYSRWSTRRIRQLSQETRALRQLDQNLTCTVTGQDEISLLAQDINALYESLLISIKDLKRENELALEREKEKMNFLRMTSHELKTPITSMIGIVDGMIYQVGDFKNRDKYLLECRTILQEQSHLVHSILEASKLDLLLNPNQDEFSVREMLDSLMASYETSMALEDRELVYDVEDFMIQAHRFYLERAIRNIIDNALHYTKPKGIISICTQNNQIKISNQVDQPIDGEQLDHLFEPFYRPDFSRSRHDGGTGLGLYIVDQILSKHNINYSLKPRGDYMVFTLNFNQCD